MMNMNRQMKLPEIQKIMQEFEKQSEIMDMKEEMMNDVIGKEASSRDVIKFCCWLVLHLLGENFLIKTATKNIPEVSNSANMFLLHVWLAGHRKTNRIVLFSSLQVIKLLHPVSKKRSLGWPVDTYII